MEDWEWKEDQEGEVGLCGGWSNSVWSYCGDPAISHDSYHVSLVQWTSCLLPATRDTGSIPWGVLCETGILLLALSRYTIVIFVWIYWLTGSWSGLKRRGTFWNSHTGFIIQGLGYRLWTTVAVRTAAGTVLVYYWIHSAIASNDMYRFHRLLTAFSSGSRFKFPVALVVKASQERKFLQN
jgi:hypothetical protein